MTGSAPATGKVYRYAHWFGWVALALWLAWWVHALIGLKLLWSQHTLIHVPLFGADFFSQSDLAAREWHDGIDPYASRGHLFHYPPLVVWLFQWTPFFAPITALRIWIVVCALLSVGGTVLAVRVRRQLSIEQWPMTAALAFVLFSFPVVFELERSNFDFLTLGAMLLGLWLLARGGGWLEFLAGCLLAIGPWVKLYPGIMGLGLVALRRYRATAGFVVAGVAIPALAPTATMQSFDVLHIAVERVKNISKLVDQAPWGHSLSVAWLKLGQGAGDNALGRAMLAIPGDAAAAAFVLAIAGWVCFRLYRSPGADPLLYPLLLWLNAIGSCVGAIANDYSLAFLPLAIVAVSSVRDPWLVRVCMAATLLWLQPVDLKLVAPLLLIFKVLGLIAVGVSLVRRAHELALERSAKAEPAPDPSRSARDALPQAEPAQ